MTVAKILITFGAEFNLRCSLFDVRNFRQPVVTYFLRGQGHTFSVPCSHTPLPYRL